jgi:hypothetical protein
VLQSLPHAKVLVTTLPFDRYIIADSSIVLVWRLPALAGPKRHDALQRGP